jgi:hypothetical protein
MSGGWPGYAPRGCWSCAAVGLTAGSGPEAASAGARWAWQRNDAAPADPDAAGGGPRARTGLLSMRRGPDLKRRWRQALACLGKADVASPERERGVASVRAALLPGSGFLSPDRSPAGRPAVPGRPGRRPGLRRRPGGHHLSLRLAADRGQPDGGCSRAPAVDSCLSVTGFLAGHRKGAFLHRREPGGRRGPVAAGPGLFRDAGGPGPRQPVHSGPAAAGRGLGP